MLIGIDMRTLGRHPDGGYMVIYYSFGAARIQVGKRPTGDLGTRHFLTVRKQFTLHHFDQLKQRLLLLLLVLKILRLTTLFVWVLTAERLLLGVDLR